MTAIRLIRWLLVFNLGLVGLQPVSAGFILSGYGRATAIHGAVALALQVGALIQTITAAVLFLQVGLGYNDWAHQLD